MKEGINKSQIEPKKNEYGHTIYQFFALSKSGILHLAHEYDSSFDENGDLERFGTFCGGGGTKHRDDGWKTRWTFSVERPPSYERMCRGCRDKAGYWLR